MRIDFRQGIITYPNSDGTQLFLEPQGEYVNLKIEAQPVDISFAYKHQNYLFSETASIEHAWGPLLPDVEYWLYWDIDKTTGIRTFGKTQYAPIVDSGLSSAYQDIVFDRSVSSMDGSTPTNIITDITFDITINSRPLTVILQQVNITTYQGLVDELTKTLYPYGYATSISTTEEFIIRIGSLTPGNNSIVVLGPFSIPFILTLPYYKLIAPNVLGATTPTNVDQDQHWFNTTDTTMYVYENNTWRDVIRVFAAKVKNIDIFPLGSLYDIISHDNTIISSPTNLLFAGSQVGINHTNTITGRILFDGNGIPLRDTDNLFLTTEHDMFINSAPTNDIKLESNIIHAKARENIPKYHLVKLTDFYNINIAQYNDIQDTILFMCLENTQKDTVGTICAEGKFENPNWNFKNIGGPLWITDTGELTESNLHLIDLNNHPQYKPPVAWVLTPTSIIFSQTLGGDIIEECDDQELIVDFATESVYGKARLSVPADQLLDPIVVGDNDPRLLPYIHPDTHPAEMITTNSYGFVKGRTLDLQLKELIDRDLTTLSDVTVVDPQKDQFLRYNGIRWTNTTIELGATELDGLKDVWLDNEFKTQVLVYNGTQWINKTVDFGATELDELDDVSILDPELNQFLVFNGYEWVNTDVKLGASTLDGLDDVRIDISTLNSNQIIVYDGNEWVNRTVEFGATILDELNDVTITNPTNNQILQYDGSQWVNIDPRFGATVLDELYDVIITNPSLNNVLRYNGSLWINSAINFGATVLDELMDVTVKNPYNKQLLLYNASTNQWTNTSVPLGVEYIDELTDVEITNVTDGQILRYDRRTLTWVNTDADFGAKDLNQLTDVTITAPANNQVLLYDTTTNQWINAVPECCIDTLDDLSDVVIIEPLTPGQVLTYNGSYWTNADPDCSALEDKLKTVTKIEIVGPTELPEGTQGSYTVKVYYSNDTQEFVTPNSWYVNSIDNISPPGSIAPDGVYTAPMIATSDQYVTISATYVFKGVASYDTHDVRITELSNILGIDIIGLNEIRENTSQNYDILVRYSDGTDLLVDPDVWLATKGTINATGMLAVGFISTPSDTTQLTASYQIGGTTYTDTKDVTIISIKSVTIEGLDTIPEKTSSPYTLKVTYQDNSEIIVTDGNWTVAQGSITTDGIFTAPDVYGDTTVTINATYKTFTPSKPVLVTDIVSSRTRAYYAGGMNDLTALNEIDALMYDTKTTVNTAAGLTVARYELAGVYNENKAYFIGGIADDYSTEVDGLLFSTETVLNPSSVLATPMHFTTGVSSSTDGYTAGGFRMPPGGFSTVPVAEFSKINFTTESISVPTNTLALPRGECGCVQDPLKGYIAGGFNGVNSVSVVDKLIFSTDTTSVITSTLTTPTLYFTGSFNTTTGYFSGGYTIDYSDRIEKISFSTETIVPISAKLSLGRAGLASASNTTNGFIAGGYTTTIESDNIENLDFTNETCTLLSAKLVRGRFGLVGV